MLGYGAKIVLALACLLVALPAKAYLGPPSITPASPVAGQTVAVSMPFGFCDIVDERPDYPLVTRDGSSIRVVLYTFRFEDIILCHFPEGVSRVPFGAFPPGDYQVTIDVVWAGPFAVPMSETMAVVPMHIGGGAVNPTAAPAMSTAGMLGLIAVLCIAGLRSRRRIPLMAAIVIGAHASLPRANKVPSKDFPIYESIQLLLSSAPGAPTPERIIEYGTHGGAAPPIKALRDAQVTGVAFLLHKRAEGDLLEFLRSQDQVNVPGAWA
jgi:hypothetical protein